RALPYRGLGWGSPGRAQLLGGFRADDVQRGIRRTRQQQEARAAQVVTQGALQREVATDAVVCPADDDGLVVHAGKLKKSGAASRRGIARPGACIPAWCISDVENSRPRADQAATTRS